MITGQIMVRDTGDSARRLDGSCRKLVMIFGVIAVPYNTPIQGEHQYTVYGESLNSIAIDAASEIDRTEEGRGNGPGGLLCYPIWRI